MLVEMNAATDAEYLPLARRIAADENVSLSDAQLLYAIAGNNGSFRSVVFSVLRLAKRTARQNASAAEVGKTAAISACQFRNIPLLWLGHDRRILQFQPKSHIPVHPKHSFSPFQSTENP